MLAAAIWSSSTSESPPPRTRNIGVSTGGSINRGQLTHIDAVGDDVLEEVCCLGWTKGPGAAVRVGQVCVLLDVAALLGSPHGSAATKSKKWVKISFCYFVAAYKHCVNDDMRLTMSMTWTRFPVWGRSWPGHTPPRPSLSPGGARGRCLGQYIQTDFLNKITLCRVGRIKSFLLFTWINLSEADSHGGHGGGQVCEQEAGDESGGYGGHAWLSWLFCDSSLSVGNCWKS